ncbi:hypothetical protein [Companilactobacillus versmoldensis]|uniref:SAM-dependent methyltransferase n=1 Tax=Companilactobacillus versmoldensis DSM 14857 = KCTC 3814 TaxID=1423815 RepID=A0A0R1SH09_9LACO|nr:hypothetical protein [Companilactobacillus versmoldensis]KRL68513.1 hypothetical protein FC27_GL000212 [Companilactobacillus versmoldensis DSM 14857 = KCTC 3814]
MDYITNLRDIAAQLPKSQVFNARLNFMEHIVNALKQQKLPRYHFPQFELSEIEIERYLKQNFDLDQTKFDQTVNTLHQFDDQLSEFRTYLQVRFGYWATITDQLMDQWTELFPDNTYLELMAGNGYISRGFLDRGVKSICTDNLSWSGQSQTGHLPLTKVIQTDAVSALDQFGSEIDSVVLAWSPDHNEIDNELLQLIRQTELNFFVIGEKYGATNSHKFWDDADIVEDDRIDKLNEVYSQYDLVNDKIFLIR